MAVASLLPNGEQQFTDGNGAPYANGKVYFYIPTTTTYKNTWQDPAQMTLNTNPVNLDSNGRAIIYGIGQYSQVLYDQFGNLIWNQITQDASYSLPTAPTFAGVVTAPAFAVNGINPIANGITEVATNQLGAYSNSNLFMEYDPTSHALEGLNGVIAVNAVQGAPSASSFVGMDVAPTVNARIFSAPGLPISFYTGGAGNGIGLQVDTVANSVNFLDVAGTASGGAAVNLTATGTDTNITIALHPKGTGTVTGVTPAVNDSSTNLATTAFVNPARVIASSGYQEFASGLYMVWGLISSTTTGYHIINFPYSFPNNCFSVNVTGTNSASTGPIVVTAITSTTFTINNNTGGNTPFYFMAIGN